MVRYEQSQTIKNIRQLLELKHHDIAQFEISAKIARKRGYHEFSEILQKIADHDKEHVLAITEHLKYQDDMASIVHKCADEKHKMHYNIISEYEHIANLENIKPAQELFAHLKEIDAEHEKILLKMLLDVQSRKVFHKDNVSRWVCRKCGYVSEGVDAPKKCAVCKRTQGYFEILR